MRIRTLTQVAVTFLRWVRPDRSARTLGHGSGFAINLAPTKLSKAPPYDLL